MGWSAACGAQAKFLLTTSTRPLPSPPMASHKLYYFIAQDNRNTTKHFSQEICRYRQGGFTRLQGLPRLLNLRQQVMLDLCSRIL